VFGEEPISVPLFFVINLKRIGSAWWAAGCRMPEVCMA